MFTHVECTCGQWLTVEAGRDDRFVGCPYCGIAVLVAAQPPEPPPVLTSQRTYTDPFSPSPHADYVPESHYQPFPQEIRVRCPYCHSFVAEASFEKHVEMHAVVRGQYAETPRISAPTPIYYQTDEQGFLEAPRYFWHHACRKVTRMPDPVIRNYVSNPWTFLSNRIYCSGCRRDVMQNECRWEETHEDLATYFDRLRQHKPHLRPNPITLLIAWAFNTFRF